MYYYVHNNIITKISEFRKTQKGAYVKYEDNETGVCLYFGVDRQCAIGNVSYEKLVGLAKLLEFEDSPIIINNTDEFCEIYLCSNKYCDRLLDIILDYLFI